jgi:hypothetical protein
MLYSGSATSRGLAFKIMNGFQQYSKDYIHVTAENDNKETEA